ILLLQAKIKDEHCLNRKKSGRKRKSINPISRTAHLLNRRYQLCLQVVNDYTNIFQSQQQRVGIEIYCWIYDIFYMKGVLLELEPRPEMLCVFRDNDYLSFDENDEMELKRNLRKTQRFLKKNGYRRGKRKS
ncbi:hypothetical protein A3Q56_08332, partial [Intoshia linei]